MNSEWDGGKVITYAADIGHAYRGKFAQTLCDLMQGILRKVSSAQSRACTIHKELKDPRY